MGTPHSVDSDAIERTPQQRQQEWTQFTDQWAQVYRSVYEDDQDVLAGWTDFVTGERLSEDVMSQWLECSRRRVAALAKRSVLEIGGGTGMLAAKLAPSVDRYVMSDPAAAASDVMMARATDSTPITVRAAAHETHYLDALGGPLFDCVVINSVAQYFPECAYLSFVLAQITPYLADDAVIYLGDLRIASLHHEQCRERARRLNPFASIDDIDGAATRLAQSDPELLVSPGHIGRCGASLGEEDGSQWSVAFYPRPMRSDCDLARYRFDAVLYRARPGASLPVAAAVTRWEDLDRVDRAGALHDYLRSGAGEIVSVPNSLLLGYGLSPFELAQQYGEYAVSIGLDDPKRLWVAASADALRFDVHANDWLRSSHDIHEPITVFRKRTSSASSTHGGGLS
ncbi:MAG: class I SAM-dependent methyltransferase [Rhodococcus sp.]|nr:class I SAM-dependent methyltransferase [Rhodococcus sp. (in: high G+C Gram-positive bacteria)]